MVEPQAESVFIAAGCNSYSQSLCYTEVPADVIDDQAEVIAYAAHNWLALTTEDGQVTSSLRGHEGKVQCIQWLTPGQELVSGSADGTVRIWSRQEKREWQYASVLTLPPAAALSSQANGEKTTTNTAPAAISKLAVLGKRRFPPSSSSASSAAASCFIAAATVDSVTIWHRSDVKWEVIFTVSMPPVQIPCSLALLPLDNGHVALLVGAADAKIHVWSGLGIAGGEKKINWSRVGALVGHQGWVRSLDWRPLASMSIDGEEVSSRENGQLIASASQDGKIRIWKIEAIEGRNKDGIIDPTKEQDAVAEGQEEEEEQDSFGEDDDHEIRMVIEGMDKRTYAVRLDALLVGHEDWVTGVTWHPPILSTYKKEEGVNKMVSTRPLALLSCSMDRSLIIWRPEGPRGVWTPCVRLGDLGADIGGAVGSNLLGFLGCVFNNTGTMVLAHGFGGSFHAYQKEATSPEMAPEDDEGLWRPRPFATGHFEEVADIQWEPKGRYLVSVSKDQTTRLWAKAIFTGGGGGRYHEMSRVQVHGYDLTCLDMLPGIEHRLISGADEKTLRVFDATNKVLGLLNDLCGVHSIAPARVETAYIPALGLSIKAVGLQPKGGEGVEEAGQSNNKGGGLNSDDAEAIARARTRVNWRDRGPPLEGELVDHTLWPELAKLYGHGNGITCLAANQSGTLIASACKARDAETAKVRLWDTSSWRNAGMPLPGHSSTVVQLTFSHDNNLLISVSKDRQICVYGRRQQEETSAGEAPFHLVQTVSRAHKRITWSCGWSPDDHLLATGSRDGTVKLWKRKSATMGELSEVAMFKPMLATSPGGAVGEALSVTAVAFAPRLTAAGSGNKYILAVGLDGGNIEIWTGGLEGEPEWKCCLRFEGSLPHTATVKRLRWKPLGEGVGGGEDRNELVLASGSADHTIKVACIKGL